MPKPNSKTKVKQRLINEINKFIVFVFFPNKISTHRFRNIKRSVHGAQTQVNVK